MESFRVPIDRKYISTYKVLFSFDYFPFKSILYTANIFIIFLNILLEVQSVFMNQYLPVSSLIFVSVSD